MVASPVEANWVVGAFPGATIVTSEATALPKALADVWDAIVDIAEADAASKGRVVLFPYCSPFSEEQTFTKVLDHLESCKDVCENFGERSTIVAHPIGARIGPDGAVKVAAPLIYVRKVTSSNADGDFGADPFWDGDWDIDPSLLAAAAAADGAAGAALSSSAAAAAVSDETVLDLSKQWVQALITDLGVCPFAVSAEKAGLPVGNVVYPLCRGTAAEEVYRDYWREVHRLLTSDERSASTTLLLTPRFGLHNTEAFDVLCQSLVPPLEALNLEEHIQLVFFHPEYTFRDGQDRLGSAGAANFARRSPFPMINILRTPQVRLAQKSIPTGLVYQQNEEVLNMVGISNLQKMLNERDWKGLAGSKVDRSKASHEYYATARKLQGMELESNGGIALGQEPVATASEARQAPQAPTEPAAAAAAAPKQAAAPEVAPQRAAATAEGLNSEDVKIVAKHLVTRVTSQRPLKPASFEELAGAIERMLADTAA